MVFFILGIVTFLILRAIDSAFILFFNFILNFPYGIWLYVFLSVILSSIKFFFLGISLGVIFVPVAYYIIAPIVAYEIVLESKLWFLPKPVYMDSRPKFDMVSIFSYALILYGPVLIPMRFITIISFEQLIGLYMHILNLVLSLAPYICIPIVSIYWLRDYSKIRVLRRKNTIALPSILFEWVLVILILFASTFTIALMYLAILEIFVDPIASFIALLIMIFLGYGPVLMMVFGLFLSGMYLFDDYITKIFQKFENIVVEKADAKSVSISEFYPED